VPVTQTNAIVVSRALTNFTSNASKIATQSDIASVTRVMRNVLDADMNNTKEVRDN